MDGHTGHRGVHGVVVERQGLGARIDRGRRAGPPLRPHRRARLDGQHPAVCRLVGARAGADVENRLRFAERAGYKRVRLWTNDVLTSARRLYETAGFKKIGAERHNQFGPAMKGETWELTL